MSFWVAFGVSLGNFIQGMAEISSGTGAGIGIYMDNVAETESRVLLSRPKPLQRKTQ
jgi:hypothetical protein